MRLNWLLPGDFPLIVTAVHLINLKESPEMLKMKNIRTLSSLPGIVIQSSEKSFDSIGDFLFSLICSVNLG